MKKLKNYVIMYIPKKKEREIKKMYNEYVSFRAFHEELKKEKLRKVAALLSLVENPEDPEVQSAIFDEFDVDPSDLTLDDFVLLEELSGIEIKL